MANEIIMNISKQTIIENAKKYGIINIVALCNNILGVMAYNESDEEYNFLVNTVFPNYAFEELPCRYLVVAAQIIKNTINAESINSTSSTVSNHYMFNHNHFGYITKVIVSASNIEEAKKFAFRYDGKERSENDFTIVNFDNMISELQASNNEIIFNANIGDRIEENEISFVLYCPSSGATYEYKTVKNHGKPKEEKSDMHILCKKGKHDTFLYTGSYRCNRHENVAAAFFTV